MGIQGNLFFEVKWEGFEKKSDRTMEPEENLACVPARAHKTKFFLLMSFTQGICITHNR